MWTKLVLAILKRIGPWLLLKGDQALDKVNRELAAQDDPELEIPPDNLMLTRHHLENLARMEDPLVKHEAIEALQHLAEVSSDQEDLIQSYMLCTSQRSPLSIASRNVIRYMFTDTVAARDERYE